MENGYLKDQGNGQMHNKKLHDTQTCSLTNTVRVIKSKCMGLMRHIACKEEVRSAYSILVGHVNGRDYLETVATNRRTIRTLKETSVRMWIGFVWQNTTVQW